MNHPLWILTICLLVFVAVLLLVSYGTPTVRAWLRRQEAWYQRVLVEQLLLDVSPRVAVGLSLAGVLVLGLAGYFLIGGWLWFLIGAAVGACGPTLVVSHLEQKRRGKLEAQLVDGITTLASSVRAGLNLVQAMELLVKNSAPPIQQEFAQLLREYAMGLELNQAMRNTANRIGSSHYRLLFAAIQMHRQRGGDAGESLDRIAESIREIQRLEGKLDALTSQGRTQAQMMGLMPLLLLLMLYGIDPEGVGLLFTQPLGRVLLLVAGLLILSGFLWIRKIMAIDI